VKTKLLLAAIVASSAGCADNVSTSPTSEAVLGDRARASLLGYTTENLPIYDPSTDLRWVEATLDINLGTKQVEARAQYSYPVALELTGNFVVTPTGQPSLAAVTITGSNATFAGVGLTPRVSTGNPVPIYGLDCLNVGGIVSGSVTFTARFVLPTLFGDLRDQARTISANHHKSCTPRTINIELIPSSIKVGEISKARFANGEGIPCNNISGWRSSNSSVGYIDIHNGNIVGNAIGTSVISYNCGSPYTIDAGIRIVSALLTVLPENECDDPITEEVETGPCEPAPLGGPSSFSESGVYHEWQPLAEGGMGVWACYYTDWYDTIDGIHFYYRSTDFNGCMVEG